MKLVVVHVIKGLGRGGAEMLLVETLRVHKKEKYDFHFIYYYSSKGQLASELEGLGGKVWNIPAQTSFGVLLSFLKTWRLIQYLNPHLIHAHMPVTGFLARCIGKVTRIPVVYTEHYDIRKYHRVTTWLNKLNYSWNKVVIAVSDATATAIKSQFPSIKNLVTIPNGVNTAKFLRSTVSLDPDLKGKKAQNKVIIGTVAVFRRQKRLDLWVELAVELLKANPKFFFVIIGDGPENKIIRDQVIDSGFKDSFLFTGLISDTRSYLATMDIFLMTSDLEGLPVALLEAMSMGCLPVTPPVGGIQSLVKPNENGLFINPVEIALSAKVILDVLDNEACFRSMQESARETIVKNNSIDTMVEKLERIYEKVALENTGFR